MHHFYVVANDGNDDVVLKLFVDETYDTQRNKEQRRAYELKKIEKMSPSVSRMALVNNGSDPAAPGDIHNVADLFSYVKNNDSTFNPKEASKLVDSEGKPLVFSHFTDEGFTLSISTKRAPTAMYKHFSSHRWAMEIGSTWAAEGWMFI